MSLLIPVSIAATVVILFLLPAFLLAQLPALSAIVIPTMVISISLL